MKKPRISEETENLLTEVVEYFNDEDKSVRQGQVARWRQFKLLWDGFTQIYYDQVAHDWRIATPDENDQAYYDKSVNVFRAYIESIIAALSVTVPAIKCFPDDAESAIDIATAKAGDRIAELLYRHNDVALRWLHALFIYSTEGMTAGYINSKSDKKYGTVKERKYTEREELVRTKSCPNCGAELLEEPIIEGEEVPQVDFLTCDTCDIEVNPITGERIEIVTELSDIVETPKSQIELEIFGGLNVKVPSWARSQEDCTYLSYDYETHYTNARSLYSNDKEIRDLIIPGDGGSNEYDRWARIPTSNNGIYPTDNVTVRHRWLRPKAFEYLDYEECQKLKKLYPDGVHITYVNDIFCEAIPESLDSCWTLTYNPLSSYIHFEPLAAGLVSLQEITVDLVSLILQTIEHGIGQTFADPAALNFDQYSKTEVSPGSVYPASGRGRNLSEYFHELRTANLSAEVLPFTQQIQSYAQLVSGALPSLFGGELEGSKTASQYSMSRAQALQRQQNTWKILLTWWKKIFDKMIIKFIKEMKEDEKLVKKDALGNFINVFVRKSETIGKIGSIELDASENLPMNWFQRKDAIMSLFQLNNPQLLQLLLSPENLPLIKEAIGLNEIIIPGEQDQTKQNEEIQLLVNSEPLFAPPDEMMIQQAIANQLPPPEPTEVSSVEIDPDFDNHKIQFEVCRRWLISEIGRLCKEENPEGYRNTVLHAKEHLAIIQQQQMQQQMQEQQGNVPPENAQVEEEVNVS